MTPRGVRRRSLARDEDGAVLVEFAIILVVLLMLVFGIIDFARVLYAANDMQSAAREGARLAAVLDDPPASEATIKATVVDRSEPLGGGGPTADDVTVTYHYAGGTPSLLQATTVRVSYPVPMITPIGALIGRGDTIRISTAVRFRWERGS